MEQSNFKRFVILTPKSMIKSARALKEALDTYINMPIILVNPNSKTYQGRHSDYVLNWGYSKQPEFLIKYTLNEPLFIAGAVNKLETFEALAQDNVTTVPWTSDHIKAREWYDNGLTVIGRKTLTGFGGTGIIILDSTEPFRDDCKLYTLYKKKKNEYRVHIFNEEVIDITQKKKKKDALELNTKIRNYHNGWVYCRSDIYIPNDLTELALKAVKALGLVHGAVDIIWNEKENKCYVLEVNTAPGLTGTTLTQYINALIKDLKS